MYSKYIINLFREFKDIHKISELTGLSEEEVDRILAENGILSEDKVSGKIIREQDAIYHLEKGPYRLEDYLRLPEDRHVELINGYFYDMASPVTVHQIIARNLSESMNAYIRRHNGDCEAFGLPLDVQPDQDDLTVVQPDVMVICDPDKVKKEGVFGAPDMVAEILSPSTRRIDLGIKCMKYESSGVREYWIIDPEGRKVIVYRFEETDIPVIYTWDEEIPVGIWDGRYKFSFNRVKEQLKKYHL